MISSWQHPSGKLKYVHNRETGELWRGTRESVDHWYSWKRVPPWRVTPITPAPGIDLTRVRWPWQ